MKSNVLQKIAKQRVRILIIVGPTASGKSALAVELARKLNGEVISADSRQVYRGMDIGTGKITKREMKGIPHHLLSIADPKKNFTAHDFVQLGRKAIQDIASRGKLPIIAGGTGFYVDALIGRITLPNVPANKKLRATLERKNPSDIFTLLKKIDPARAKSIDANNPRRLIRAIEIATALGAVPSMNAKPLYNASWIGMSPDASVLEKKIRTRLKTRIKQGMVAEARRLHSKGLSYKRMESFGLEYRALARLLQGTISKKEFEEELFRDIRRYAKRQMTYWRRDHNIVWLEPSQKLSVIQITKNL